MNREKKAKILENEIEEITDNHWRKNFQYFEYSTIRKHNLKMAICDAYKAGMEAARKVFRNKQ